MSKKAKTPALESAPLEPKPKRRRSAAKTAEPTTVAEILDKSPVMADILAARDAKSRIEPERTMPEPDAAGEEAVAAFKRQREREQASPMEALPT